MPVSTDPSWSREVDEDVCPIKRRLDGQKSVDIYDVDCPRYKAPEEALTFTSEEMNPEPGDQELIEPGSSIPGYEIQPIYRKFLAEKEDASGGEGFTIKMSEADTTECHYCQEHRRE
ncbi:hypothetical protein [Streptomyces sp. NPDC006668]|uniref:hypothetical protein n=1 Tax=Streptomyces sp. NPDC006668 TaxID=3156903 RepID=UPI0033E31B20